MDRTQVEAWARNGESETLEFKRTTGELREAARSICAMLNHRGGRVLFGIDAKGRVLGQQVSDHTLEELSQEIQQIDPPVFPRIDRVGVDGQLEVLVISAESGQNGPYSYKGVAFRRVANTSLEMSREEYHRLLLDRLHGVRRWENQPVEGWTTADLDLQEISRTVDEMVRRRRADDPQTSDPAAILRGLGLIRNDQLLRGAVVLFGGSARLEAELPQCLLRVARFRGVDRSEFIDNRQFHGHVFDLLQRADRFLRENLPVAGRIEAGLFERVDDPLYPPAALREALANAFCHRDYAIGGGSVAIGVYDDRLEVTSSGTLHFGITAEALFEPHESLPWNPLIARVLYRRGVIESWGRGTLKIAELTQRAGLPRPEIVEAGGCVTVRFRPSRYVPPQRIGHDLTKRQRTVLAVLSAGGSGLALRDVLARVSPRAQEWELKGDLAILKALGLVRSSGHGRGARWTLGGGPLA